MSRSRTVYAFALCAAAAGWLSAGSLLAQESDRQGTGLRAPRAEVLRARPQAPAGRDRSMSDSVRWAQKTTGGQVLGAERVQSDGRDFNRVKLIDGQGRVRYVDDVRHGRQPRGGVPAQPADPGQSQR